MPLGIVETTADNQNAKLKEIAMEMKKVDLVLEKTKGIKKLNQDICQTSLTMAGVLKKIEVSCAAQSGGKENSENKWVLLSFANRETGRVLNFSRRTRQAAR